MSATADAVPVGWICPPCGDADHEDCLAEVSRGLAGTDCKCDDDLHTQGPMDDDWIASASYRPPAQDPWGPILRGD